MSIELKNVSFSYGEKKILNEFSLKINDGECIALKGESGCGKSTVANIILRLLTPDSGSVSLPQNVSVVFQEDRFVDNLSLIKNLRMTAKKADYPLIEELLVKFNIESVKNQKFSSLSGGMKRRAAIIRAIVFGGEALILDEAFNGIDKLNKKICAEEIKKHFNNKPILIITHIDEDAELFGADTVYLKRM